MTPMPLERALDVALGALREATSNEIRDEAAAVLREFLEKGLPFYLAAEKLGLRRSGLIVTVENYAEFDAAYRKAREGK